MSFAESLARGMQQWRGMQRSSLMTLSMQESGDTMRGKHDAKGKRKGKKIKTERDM
jgi:hypothetical protein